MERLSPNLLIDSTRKDIGADINEPFAREAAKETSFQQSTYAAGFAAAMSVVSNAINVMIYNFEAAQK